MFKRLQTALLWVMASALTSLAGPHPNIIFVMADDLGYGDLGCYGQQRIKTTNLDRMAREGMRFTQFYAGSTVCAPSRCVLMTGYHTGRCFIRGNGIASRWLRAATTSERKIPSSRQFQPLP